MPFPTESTNAVFLGVSCSTRTTTPFRSFYVSTLKRLERCGPLPKNVWDALVGNLLGDGHAERRGQSTRIQLKQSAQKIHYIAYLHKMMHNAGLCNSQQPAVKARPSKGGKVFYDSRFATYSFGQLNALHESFYILTVGGQYVKCVPQNISQLLTPRGLAHWIMDDGSLYTHAGRVGGIRLSAESFTEKDCERLCFCLGKNFALSTTVHRHKMALGTKPVIYIEAGDLQRVQNLCKAYFERHMLYKIGLPLEEGAKRSA